jgi:nicotinamide-nucleotide amidase
MDDLNTLAIELGAHLKAHHTTLGLAESCTGGMVAQAITSVAGSSAWFDRGFVTYSNAAKIEMLGVLPETLAKYGAVSEQIALEMAQGALTHSNADITGSITGIAGPDGGSDEKPVGTVCFAWASKTGVLRATTQHFLGNRQQIRQQASVTMLTGLMQCVALQPS